MRAILTYHSIDSSGSPISLSEESFRGHVRFLGSGRVSVVPLAELRMKEKRERRPLVFVLAMIAAILVGATTATLIYSSRSQPESQTLLDSHSPAPAPQTLSPAEQTGIRHSSVDQTSAQSDAQVLSTQKDPPALRETATRSGAAKSRIPGHVPKASTAFGVVRKDRVAVDRDWPEARRAEARETSRRPEPERRRRQTRAESSDGLLRIGEIFEGTRRH